MEGVRHDGGRKIWGFLGTSNQETNSGWELVLVLALVLLRQVILGKSLSLWALVSPSEMDQEEQIMPEEAL